MPVRMTRTVIQFPEEVPVLTGEKTVLRPFAKKDAETYFQIRSMPESMKYIGKAKYRSIEEAYEWMDWIKREFDQKRSIVWCIADRESDKMLGYGLVFKFNYSHHWAMVGYALHKDFFRQGVMSDCLPLIIDYAFKEMKLHRLEANIDKRNIASESLLKKFGFKQEAHFIENYYFDGQYLDSIHFGLVNPY